MSAAHTQTYCKRYLFTISLEDDAVAYAGQEVMEVEFGVVCYWILAMLLAEFDDGISKSEWDLQGVGQ